MERLGRNLNIRFHKDFIKRVKKYSCKKSAIEEAIKLFQFDYQNPRLKAHKLTGPLLGNWAFSIDYHLRIMFYFEDGNTVVFLDIGTHEIYR